MEKRLPWILIAAGIALFLVSFLFFAIPKACAAEAANNSLDKIVSLYRDKASGWETTLRNYALTLFFLLAAIEFGVSAIRLALRGADVSEWLAELVNQVLFLGFFLALLNNSSAWAKAIVNSFRAAANQAAISSGGSSNLAPSDVFDTGLAIASKVADQASLFSPASSVSLILCALVILICFALIAAFLVLALVESYVVISAGVLLMGFGGSRFTKDYAVRTLTYAVSVGAKLFVLQLLIALGQQIFQSLSQSFEAKTTDIFVVVGSAVVMLALVKIIPEMIQALINGASIGGAPFTAGAIAGGAAAVSGAAYGTGMVVRSAGRLASEQLADARLNGAAMPTAFGRGVQFTAAAAGNIARAAIENVGDRLSGRAHFGTRLGQMSEEMERKAAIRKEERGVRQASQPASSP
jgi:type IV secretion system protein TrbL